MPLSVFFKPLNVAAFTPEYGFSRTQLGSHTRFFTEDFPQLTGSESKPDLAFFGVLDDRKAIGNEGCAGAADAVRKRLYGLTKGNYSLRMVDLGNILAGDTFKDTYLAVQTVCEELMKADIVPIIIGGGQDLTFPQYLAYQALERQVDAVIIDPRFDLDEHKTEGAPLNSRTYLNHIILHEPDYLFNLTNLAYQTYFVSQESIDLYEQLYFNATRLGIMSGKLDQVEPAIRSADMLSFDMAAIRYSDAPGNANVTSNGLFGQEACQICRYAGMSDKLSSIGFYEYNPNLDMRGQTAMLLSQMIWYFIDGYYDRKADIPFVPQTAYTTFRVALENEGHELVFIKSKKTDRWWMQVPYFGSKSVNERYFLMPCRYEDYQIAVEGEMPDLWWKTHQKLQ